MKCIKAQAPHLGSKAETDMASRAGAHRYLYRCEKTASLRVSDVNRNQQVMVRNMQYNDGF